MICDNCGKNAAREIRSTRVYGSGKTSYLVEGVPEVACRACGEHYITAKTLHELDRIRQEWRKLTVKRLVPVAKFGTAG